MAFLTLLVVMTVNGQTLKTEVAVANWNSSNKEKIDTDNLEELYRNFRRFIR